MAAYAALLSLARTSDLNTNQHKDLFSVNAKEKLSSIHEYVIFLLSFLEDFPDKAKRWEGEIRDVAHETEDIIDLFMWQKMQLSYSSPASVELEDLLKDVSVKKIGLIAGAIMEDRPAVISSSSTLAPAATSSSSRLASPGNDALIGLNDDLLAVKERLLQETSNLQFIPIVGMGGIGKTTLARTVYDDKSTIDHFHIRVWFTVSQDYSRQRFRRILLGLVDSMNLFEERMSGEDDSGIALKVFQHLKGRRYLVVMDDVWGTEVWDDVRNMFPDDNNGSRIMLTSRLLDVAAYPDSDSPLHQMQCMNDDESWNLLKQKVFTNSSYPPDLEGVGNGIARSCAGLPLAVVLVAGLLSAVDETRASWEEFAKTVNPIGGRESDEILSLSYTHLPHHLRPCFLFIGGFHEDAKISASTLIKLWVAEGFLKHQSGCSKSLEDEAEEYLEDLVKRNLLLVTRRNRNGKIKSCSLHDMVRELCIKKAQEEKFMHVMDGHVLPQDTININELRRISLNCSHIDYIWGLNIRTILGFQLKNFPIWPAFLRRFRLLRVLDTVVGNYEELPCEELPWQVFELFHLRYLVLKGFFSIPSAISNLVNLQTLIILPTFRSKRNYRYASQLSLPLEIWRMPQLRHLVFYDFYMLPHPQRGSNFPLQNLQTLLPIKNLVWNSNIAHMIPNVKRLGLVYDSNQEYHLHHLKYLLQLEKLEVNGYRGFSWRGKNPSFPRTLKKLSLMGGGFPWEDMAIIGSLPNLQVLKLLDHACNGETWRTFDEEFPELNFLEIDTSSLRHWTTQSSPLPRLKCLVLRSCGNLTEIPEDIGEIPTLEFIELDMCRRSVVDSARQIEKDQWSCGNDAFQVHVKFILMRRR